MNINIYYIYYIYIVHDCGFVLIEICVESFFIITLPLLLLLLWSCLRQPVSISHFSSSKTKKWTETFMEQLIVASLWHDAFFSFHNKHTFYSTNNNLGGCHLLFRWMELILSFLSIYILLGCTCDKAPNVIIVSYTQNKSQYWDSTISAKICQNNKLSIYIDKRVNKTK